MIVIKTGSLFQRDHINLQHNSKKSIKNSNEGTQINGMTLISVKRVKITQ